MQCVATRFYVHNKRKYTLRIASHGLASYCEPAFSQLTLELALEVDYTVTFDRPDDKQEIGRNLKTISFASDVCH